MGVKIFAVFVLISSIFFLLGYNMHPAPLLIPSPEVNTTERDSPSNWLDQEQIHVYQDRIVIEVESPQWAIIADTNSMDPILDAGSHALQVVPSSPEDLQVGDIISFTKQNFEGIIIHRIIEIGADDQGWYAITQGDNNQNPDPGRLRFNQIHRVMIGVLY